MTTTNTTRREVLLAAAGVLAAATLPIARAPMSRAQPRADVVVIGSGYAGAVTALRLAQKGISCVVLERGRRWPITAAGDTFATAVAPDARAVWLPGVATGVLEVVTGSGINCFAGAGVGGGSLVNYTVMMTPEEDLFTASFGDRLDYDEMVNRWYPRARELIGCSPIPDDVLAAGQYSAARAFDEASRRAGLEVRRVPMATDWDVVREEIGGRIGPSATAGDCILGVNSGAKLSVDRTILAAAEATGLVTVLPLHSVTDVRADGDHYSLTCAVLDTAGQTRSTAEFHSSTVVFAAGSIGTSKLLVRARARGDLARLPADVGRYWGSSGDHVTVRLGRTADGQGGPAHIVALDWRSGTTPTTLLNFPLGVPVLGGLSQNALAVSITPPSGSLVYDAGLDRVELRWPADDPEIGRVTKDIGTILAKIGAVTSGAAPALALPAVTSHPLGGAVLGTVTDSYGRIDAHPGLYVVDSSLVPGSTGAVPPALTVTALADRCASALVADLTR
ncbi:FAD-dependent oxidoreductase [Nocardia sp. NPDC060249]|uniref:FAD-dependent oxidoreductase n=1 Tax=Nocardia sp. NPDC060249 TaxID=3347082 RepID=UPI0036490713